MGTPAPRPTISDTEMEVLKALWEDGPGTVREINERLFAQKRRWAYTTVQTLLGRLKGKGYVARDESGLAHVFRASVTREKLLGWRLRELADQVCGGETTPLVLSLVQRNALTEGEIASLRALLDDKSGSESGSRKRAKKRD